MDVRVNAVFMTLSSWMVNTVFYSCSAAATSGLSILHLDNDSEYGSDWAALDPRSFLERLRRAQQSCPRSQLEQEVCIIVFT